MFVPFSQITFSSWRCSFMTKDHGWRCFSLQYSACSSSPGSTMVYWWLVASRPSSIRSPAIWVSRTQYSWKLQLVALGVVTCSQHGWYVQWFEVMVRGAYISWMWLDYIDLRSGQLHKNTCVWFCLFPHMWMYVCSKTCTYNHLSLQTLNSH